MRFFFSEGRVDLHVEILDEDQTYKSNTLGRTKPSERNHQTVERERTSSGHQEDNE